jgi:S-methylmethionine-dependent homocysteine/selenocysteine methylase
LTEEHRELADELRRAGVELILVETMVTGVEAEAAARAAMETGLPFVVSFVTGPGGRLLSGELLSAVLPRVAALGPAAIGINCVSPKSVDAALGSLMSGTGGPDVSVYANTGERAEDGSWRVTNASEPAVYAGLAKQWLERGVSWIGGCCGTTPGHIRAMQAVISEWVA